MNILQHILVGFIRFYRWMISPALKVIFGPGSGCRYTPTCSAYAMEAIGKHGVFKGVFLGGKRICRCHPWGSCGVDPVPETLKNKALAGLSCCSARRRSSAALPAKCGSSYLKSFFLLDHGS